MRREARPTLLALAGAMALAGCNSYPVLRVTGYEQASFNNKADILFVIDNSGSMRDNESEMALNFNAFVDQLTSAEGSNVSQATLADAANNFIRETTATASGPVDYQLAITTTTADYTAGGASAELEPGEAGTLIGPVITRDDADVEAAFMQQLLCDTIYWNEAELASDPTYVPNSDGSCPEPTGDVVTEYLDCVCGGDFNLSEGAGNEEGLESALLAMCRAEPGDPPADCTSPDAPYEDSWAHTTTDFLREDATTLVVIVTDEGDGSRRLATADNDPSLYLDIFDQFTNPVRFAVIGPPYRDKDGSCLDSAQTWGVERYQVAASETQGAYFDLTNLDEDCTPSDWSENLQQLGALLQNLLTVFPLQAVPDVSTIRVYIDGVEVSESQPDPADGSVEDGTAIWGTGWTYDSGENAVSFHGDAIPDYNADVKIYYKPLGGMSRELPF